MDVVIDVGAAQVHLGESRLSGQWVDFYALLALACTGCAGAPSYLTVESLARVGPWRPKAVESAGKEVSRHLSWLSRSGAGHLVEHRGKTRAWRLSLSPASLRFLPDREAVQSWIDSRTRGAPTPGDDWVAGIQSLVRATTAVQSGQAESALDLLEGITEQIADAEPELRAWRALLRGRAAAQADDDDLLDRLDQEYATHTDAPGRAVGARLRATVAHRRRFDEPDKMLASLVKLAADLELHGDLGALGAVTNVMGLLARRTGRPELGLAHHLRATALAGISGDYPMLQAALFNMAICRGALLERAGQPPDEAIFTLVDACIDVCGRFGVGRDSAEAEIAGAQWAHQAGDLPRALDYLRRAEILVKTLESTHDQAYFLEVRATIESSTRNRTGRVQKDLRAAEHLFEKSGDASSATRIRRRLRGAFRTSKADTTNRP